MVHEMCTEMSHAIGKLVVGIGKLGEGQPGSSKNVDNNPQASEHCSSRRKRATPRVIEHSSSVDAESFKSDKQSEDEDHNKDNESEPGSGNSGDDSEDDGSDDDDDNTSHGGNVRHNSAEDDANKDSEQPHETT